MVSIRVVSTNGSTRYENTGISEVTLGWRGFYQPGDAIEVTCDEGPCHLVMRLDQSCAQGVVFLRGGRFVFPIPLGEERCTYGKGWAFEEERHWGFVRKVDPRELFAWRNLALNAHDLPQCYQTTPTLYPHASTNVAAINPQFFARNAIDGIFETCCHGSWPHGSWGTGGRDDAWLRVDFGEPVVADELRLYLRADYPHDTWWRSARVSFSDGTSLPLAFKGQGGAQSFELGGRVFDWLRFDDFVRDDPAGYAAFSQVMVMGRLVG